MPCTHTHTPLLLLPMWKSGCLTFPRENGYSHDGLPAKAWLSHLSPSCLLPTAICFLCPCAPTPTRGKPTAWHCRWPLGSGSTSLEPAAGSLRTRRGLGGCPVALVRNTNGPGGLQQREGLRQGRAGRCQQAERGAWGVVPMYPLSLRTSHLGRRRTPFQEVVPPHRPYPSLPTPELSRCQS